MKKFLKVISVIASTLLLVGIILVVSGFLSGGRVKSISLIGGQTGDYKDIEQTFGDSVIENLDLQVAAGKLHIVEGDEFSVKATNIIENTLDIAVRDKTLCVKEKNKDGWGWLYRIDWIFDHKESSITVTIPYNFVAKDVELETKAGSMTVDKLSAETLDIDVSAGKTRLDKVTVTKEASIDLSAGSLLAEKCDIKNLDVDLSAGSCDLSGAFYGEIGLECSAGSIDFETTLADTEYSFDLSQNAGSIRVNGENYKHYDEKESTSGNKIKADTSAGSIKIETK